MLYGSVIAVVCLTQFTATIWYNFQFLISLALCYFPLLYASMVALCVALVSGAVLVAGFLIAMVLDLDWLADTSSVPRPVKDAIGLLLIIGIIFAF